MSRGWLSAMALFYLAFLGALVAFRLA
jgi:hypothetical protein